MHSDCYNERGCLCDSVSSFSSNVRMICNSGRIIPKMIFTYNFICVFMHVRNSACVDGRISTVLRIDHVGFAKLIDVIKGSSVLQSR